MDVRAEKLAKARKKLRDHQEKKITLPSKEDGPDNDTCSPNNIEFTESLENANIMQDPLIHEKSPGVCNEINLNIHNVSDVNVTEFLISDKAVLEMQVKDLNMKLMQLETLFESKEKENQILEDKVNTLQIELNNVTKQLRIVSDENAYRETLIDRLQKINNEMHSEKSDVIEQLEVTKGMLKSKESDNIRLQNDVQSYRSQVETAKLHIQQLTNDSGVSANINFLNLYDSETLNNKLLILQQQIDALQKERDQINSHYEHYVKELNEQINKQNEEKQRYCENYGDMHDREMSLIQQLSEMEKRLQNCNNMRHKLLDSSNVKFSDLEEKYKISQTQLEEAKKNYNELQKQYEESLVRIKTLSETREQDTNSHDNICMSKLNADITSDKVALQRAMEQNKKLKVDIEDLELVAVKMTKDKLELTEMLNHEKNLNKDLILKLTDIEESTKNMNSKLKAKDEEMMRLQSGYREIENKHGKLLQDLSSIKEKTSTICQDENRNNKDVTDTTSPDEETSDLLAGNDIDEKEIEGNQNIPKNDAMLKLQERFLKIMNEVANLSDEKHRLEHIILQLQNETDTICEYVALYQQQRSLLKKREEERNHQIGLFQKECVQLKQNLEELRKIVLQVIEDPKLESYFKNQGIEVDIIRGKQLLDILQSNSLVEANLGRLDLNIFYPCSCCSGQLIDV